jgi:hypothetical protein
MLKGVVLSELSDSGMLNAEAPISTDITILSRLFLSAYSLGYQPKF